MTDERNVAREPEWAAMVADALTDVPGLVWALRNQRQLDHDGTEVAVSRQAVDYAAALIEHYAAPAPRAELSRQPTDGEIIDAQIGFCQREDIAGTELVGDAVEYGFRAGYALALAPPAPAEAAPIYGPVERHWHPLPDKSKGEPAIELTSGPLAPAASDALVAHALNTAKDMHLSLIATAIESLQAQLAALEREIAELKRDHLARSKIDPSTRLHNLCDHLAEHRRESPFDQASWDLQDAAYREKCAELKRAEASAAAEREALRELVACKDMADRLDAPSPYAPDEWMRMDAEYRRRKPLAWAAARAAMCELERKP